jgi:large-conductance mechanosensitive channel
MAAKTPKKTNKNVDETSEVQQAEATIKANQKREIREVATKLRHLSPVAKAEVMNQLVNEQVGKQVNGFTNFLREQSVIGIGIGLVLGTQIKGVVDTIMLSLVNPISTLVLPGEQALTDKTFTVNFASRHAEIGWGAIAYSLFSFTMVAVIVYVLYKVLKLDKLAKKKD